jgi:predicted AlkP superfamily phosphohydrolase/phosphomutase
VSRARDDDIILFISDHGFQSCTRTVNMDRLLKQFGYLEFSASNTVFGPMQWGPMRKVARKVYDVLGLHGKVSLPQSVNWQKTRAFTTIRSTGEGVSINLAGRDLDGTVDPGDYEQVRDELMDRLGSYVDPKTGKKPVKSIARREEVFKGKFADQAPDIMMVPAEGYSLTHAKSAIEDADWVSGDHRMEGVIVAVGPQVKAFERSPALIDMAPTLVAALDAPTAVKPTGRILHEIVGSGAELTEREVAPGDEGSTAPGPAIPGMTIPGMGNESAVNESEADEMEEHLRGLGYIE